MILETERLVLRKMNQGDFDALCRILQDEEAMYAYEGAFSDGEVQEWLDRQIGRYENDGFGLWAVLLKENGRVIGQCGLTMQDCGERRVPEVGYLFERAYWHRGYALEAAAACRDYAFRELGADEVFSIIRDNNIPSQKVARRNGMEYRETIIKHYRGVVMPHLVFSVKRTKDPVSPCGVVCPECGYYGTEDGCGGCREIQGKPFWLAFTGGKSCEIFDCCTYTKQFHHCGKCSELPCPLYDGTVPARSEAENQETFEKQMEQLKRMP